MKPVQNSQDSIVLNAPRGDTLRAGTPIDITRLHRLEAIEFYLKNRKTFSTKINYNRTL